MCALLGFLSEKGLLRVGNQGVAVLFCFSFFLIFFFSLAKEEYNQSFVFRMLCNILERDIGVSRDLVKQNKNDKKKKVDQICTVSIVPDFFKFVLKA